MPSTLPRGATPPRPADPLAQQVLDLLYVEIPDASPIGAGADEQRDRMIQIRRRALVDLFTELDPGVSRHLLDRLAPGGDLAEHFHHRLATATRRQLRRILEAKPPPAPQRVPSPRTVTTPTPHTERMTRERMTRERATEEPDAPPDDEPRKPHRNVDPPPRRRRRVRERDTDGDDGLDWFWRALDALGYSIGTGVTVGALLVIPPYVVKQALRQAFLVLVGEAVTNQLIGLAGERAGIVVAEWTVGKSGTVLDLNSVRANFPLADLLAPDKPIDVKTLLVNGRFEPPPPTAPQKAHIEWERRVGSRYANAFLRMSWDSHPRAVAVRKSAAKAWLDAADQIKGRGLWPASLGEDPSEEELIDFIRNKTVLLVPSDHAGIARNYIGQTLHNRYLQGKLHWPKGLSQEELAARITAQMARIESIGISGRDLRMMIDVLRRLPAVQARLTRGRTEPWPAEWGDPPLWTGGP